MWVTLTLLEWVFYPAAPKLISKWICLISQRKPFLWDKTWYFHNLSQQYITCHRYPWAREPLEVGWSGKLFVTLQNCTGRTWAFTKTLLVFVQDHLALSSIFSCRIRFLSLCRGWSNGNPSRLKTKVLYRVSPKKWFSECCWSLKILTKVECCGDKSSHEHNFGVFDHILSF